MKKMDICFYPTDDVELRFIAYMIEELNNRGHEASADSTMSKRSKMGIFLAHHAYNKPELADTSIIMLHDLGQAHGMWPYFWHNEPWGRYDYGILPNKLWENMYRNQYLLEIVSNIQREFENFSTGQLSGETAINLQMRSSLFPKNGVRTLGWPKYKLDNVLFNRNNYIREVGTFAKRKFLNVLYAPSWEFNNQQDNLITSIVDLPVHIFVKQQSWLGDGGEHMARVNEMAEKHKGKWSNVTILDPKSDIFDALACADCIISDESSTLSEGALIGVLPIAVSDWLVPDTIPPRFASTPYPYVKKILSTEIRKTIENLLLPNALEAAKDELDFSLLEFEGSDDPVKATIDFIIEKTQT